MDAGADADSVTGAVHRRLLWWVHGHTVAGGMSYCSHKAPGLETRRFRIATAGQYREVCVAGPCPSVTRRSSGAWGNVEGCGRGLTTAG